MKDTEQQQTQPGADAAAGGVQVDDLPVTTPLTNEQLDALKDKASKAEEYWDRLLRQTADFDNYKKRAAREKSDAIKYANEGLLQKLIPILDNFEAALAAVPTENATASAQSLQQGVSMIHSLLRNALLEAGLEEIDATNQVFDPNLHEAVSQKEPNEVADGHVVQQMRKGYKFRERLVRPASVVVAKKPSA
ncbi:MAG: GrpE protein [Verrucomicrobiales bacterium]|nr:GrpE protein [Verrucomicrobiales bacterium]